MYEASFGLSANPFRLQPDTRFFYWSRGHQAAHRSLHDTLDRGDAFIAVTGEVGAGKTTLTQLLLSGFDPCLTLVVHLVSTQFDAANFVQALRIAFALPARAPAAKPRSAREQLGEIEAFLLTLNRRGMKAVLVIDEAQNLSGDALNELFTLGMMLRDRNVTVLQCVLVGQPELADRLEQAAQRRLGLPALASFHLGQLEPGEVQSYVEHRLGVVGWKNNPRLDAGAYEVLYSATDGIPRRINSLCNRLLLGASLAGKRRITRGDVEETAAELRDEIGVDALPSAGPRLPGRAAPAAKDKAAMQSLLVSSVAARLDRLERHVTTMLKKVQVLAQARLEKPRPARVLNPSGAVNRPGWRR
jgi:type II secretory pathway predicted ATPase ExeA